MWTWLLLPWVAAASAVLAAVAVLAWRRGRRGTAVRWIGLSLLPWAAWLLGLVSLIARVSDAATDWARRFAFSPSAWVGVALAVVAMALVLLGGRLGTRARPAPSRPPAADTGDDDIEALLRKHGIS